jgi:UTP--glucose-1-phosphate uridylyltransferase
MLPIVDRPAVQYVVEEAVRAGLDDVLFVTAMGKSAVEDHFDRRLDLEAALEAKGRTDDLEAVRSLASLASVHSVRQPEPLGLGHAVLMAAGHVGRDESFAVLLGDDLLEPDSTFLARMIATHERTGAAVIALLEVDDPAALSQYGVVSIAPPSGDDVPGEVRITDLVEKPAPGSAPSNLAVIGRYVLPGAIFDVLEDTPPGRGGEIQLTDALRTLAARGPLVGVVLDEPRHDAGDRLGFLKATVAFAAGRADLGAELLDWVEEELPALRRRADAAGSDGRRADA